MHWHLIDNIFPWVQFACYIASNRTGFFLLLTATFMDMCCFSYCQLLPLWTSVLLDPKRIKKIDQGTRHGSQVYNITVARTIIYISMCLVLLQYLKFYGELWQQQLNLQTTFYKKIYILDGYTSLHKFVHQCVDIFVQREKKRLNKK